MAVVLGAVCVMLGAVESVCSWCCMEVSCTSCLSQLLLLGLSWFWWLCEARLLMYVVAVVILMALWSCIVHFRQDCHHCCRSLCGARFCISAGTAIWKLGEARIYICVGTVGILLALWSEIVDLCWDCRAFNSSAKLDCWYLLGLFWC